jgi:hypothetical protein
MAPNGKLELREAWRSLAPRQGFLVRCLGIAIIAAATLLGAVLQGAHDRRNLARKEDRVSEVMGDLHTANGGFERRLADLTIETGELLRRYAALEAGLNASRSDRQALAAEAEFLNRYIAYSVASNGANAKPSSPKPLIDTLCLLWRSGDKQGRTFETQPLQLTEQDFQQGRISLELQTLLVQNFVSLDPLQQIRLADAGQPGPAKAGKPASHQTILGNSGNQQTLASVGKQAQAIKIVKSIAFADGARYEIPKSVAIALQIRRECLPY